jgi:putative oxidoreductase
MSSEKSFIDTLARDDVQWHILRVTLAVLIGIHGWHRLINGGVTPFGGWLGTQGIPFGLAVAWSITIVEMIGAPLFAARRFVVPLAAIYVAIYVCGVVMIHAKAGWFVVGSGRNGMEFSVLLIVCLLVLALRELGNRANNTANQETVAR